VRAPSLLMRKTIICGNNTACSAYSDNHDAAALKQGIAPPNKNRHQEIVLQATFVMPEAFHRAKSRWIHGA